MWHLDPYSLGCHHVLTFSSFAKDLSESTFVFSTACANRVEDLSWPIFWVKTTAAQSFWCYWFLLCLKQQWVKIISWLTKPQPLRGPLEKVLVLPQPFPIPGPFPVLLGSLQRVWPAHHLSWEHKMSPYKSKMRFILPCLKLLRCVYRYLHIRHLSPEMRLQTQKLQIYVGFQQVWFQVFIAPQRIVPGAKRDTNLKFLKQTLHVRAPVITTAGF